MMCPDCGQPVPADGRFCPFCGAALAAPAETNLPGTVFHCPTCGEAALPDARFCAACGRELPSAADDAAAAVDAAGAVSSSGRDDGTDPRSRAVFLGGLEADARLDRLIPPLSGDRLADLAAYDRAVERAEQAWDELDRQWRDAGGAVADDLYGTPEQLAEQRRMKLRADHAWLVRQRAVEGRDRLERAVSGDSPKRDRAAQERAMDLLADWRRRMER